MKTSTTAQRLREYMNETGLRQVDVLVKCLPFCEKAGVKISKSHLSQYVSGKREPRQNKLEILSKALNVDEAWLMGYDVPKERNIQDVYKISNIFPIEKKKFPLLGTIACGKPIFADEESELYVEADADIKADFCLRANGDSMIGARILNGDIVFIRAQPEVENWEIAAVIIGDEATLKRVRYDKENGVLSLYSENPKYLPMHFSGDELNEIRIIGKAVAFQSSIK